ncbi:MAG: recombinase family protein [Bacteroidales bacterium]|nr:recombinase family protein [Bacteroidales bacterium]
MKGIALIRVSTESQDLQQQTDVVVKRMMDDGYRKEDIICIENKESGVKLSEEERQGLTRLKECIENDKDVNSVYVYEISRLSRKPDVIYSIREFLIKHNVQLVVLNPFMKLFNDKGEVDPTTMVVFGVFSSMSEQEGYLRKERVTRGRRKSVKEGKWIGGYLPFGYKVGEDNKIVINEEEAIVVRKIFERYSSIDISMRKLGKELMDVGDINCIHYQDGASRVHGILVNEKYTGIPFGKYGMRYPPIIEKELFEKVSLLRKQRKTEPKSLKKHICLLQGIIRDGLSKRVLIANSSIAMYNLYLEYPDGTGLQSSINLNVTDSVAWYLTMEYQTKTNKLSTKKVLKETEKNINELTRKIQVGKEKLKSLEDKEDKIQRRIIDGKLREEKGDEMLSEIYELMEDLQIDLETWEMRRINEISYYQAVECMGFIPETDDLSSITDPEQKRHLIIKSIKSFDVYQIIEKKRYYMGVVTFTDDSTVSFTINTYSKVVKYLDGEKMNYTFIRTIPRADMKPTYYKKKTDETCSRSWNKPQPDIFKP